MTKVGAMINYNHKRTWDYLNKMCLNTSKHKIIWLKGTVHVSPTEWERCHSKMAFAGIANKQFNTCFLGNVVGKWDIIIYGK